MTVSTPKRAGARMAAMPKRAPYSAEYTARIPSGPSESTRPTSASTEYTAAIRFSPCGAVRAPAAASSIVTNPRNSPCSGPSLNGKSARAPGRSQPVRPYTRFVAGTCR